jgi:hypothetical protein
MPANVSVLFTLHQGGCQRRLRSVIFVTLHQGCWCRHQLSLLFTKKEVAGIVVSPLHQGVYRRPLSRFSTLLHVSYGVITEGEEPSKLAMVNLMMNLLRTTSTQYLVLQQVTLVAQTMNITLESQNQPKKLLAYPIEDECRLGQYKQIGSWDSFQVINDTPF